MGVRGTRWCARVSMVVAGLALSTTLEGLQAPEGMALGAGSSVGSSTGSATPGTCADDPSFRRRDWHDLDQGSMARARSIAEAATWQVDPALLEVAPTDSARTVAARQALADLSARVHDRVAAYDATRAEALALAESARGARRDLGVARDRLRAARKRYRADRDVLVSVLTQNYTMTQLAPVAATLTGGDGDLPAELTRLEEMGRTQAQVVQRSERSRAHLGAAERTFAVVAARADADLCAAREATASALRARDLVVAELELARTEVTTSVLADVRDARTSATGGTGVPGGVATGLDDAAPGSVVFPLAPGTAFVDQDNFGGTSGLWASTHTGDDLSAACGSTVVAATGGTVMIRTDQGWSGRWLVMVTTGEGSLTTWYAHLQRVDVGDGAPVRAGEPIGQVGQEGNATGCHLHFEVHPRGGGIYEDDTDPVPWLHEVGAYPGED